MTGMRRIADGILGAGGCQSASRGLGEKADIRLDEAAAESHPSRMDY